MKNLKKKSFKELDSSEMKQVQGGGPLDDVLNRVKDLLPIKLVKEVLIII